MPYISAASLCVALPTLGDKNATAKILWSELLAAQDRENTSHQEHGLCGYVCMDARSSVTYQISGMVESLHIEVGQSGVATNFLATRRVIPSTKIEHPWPTGPQQRARSGHSICSSRQDFPLDAGTSWCWHGGKGYALACRQLLPRVAVGGY